LKIRPAIHELAESNVKIERHERKPADIQIKDTQNITPRNIELIKNISNRMKYGRILDSDDGEEVLFVFILIEE
jgi:hypothetical protein